MILPSSTHTLTHTQPTYLSASLPAMRAYVSVVLLLNGVCFTLIKGQQQQQQQLKNRKTIELIHRV